MEENLNPRETPAGKENSAAKTLVLILIIAIVSGAITYACVTGKAAKEKADLNKQIAALQSEIDSLKASQGNLPPESTSEETALTQIPAGWDTYANDEYGFQISYPVNSIDNNGPLHPQTDAKSEGSKYVFGLRQDKAQDDFVNISFFTKKEDFADMIAVRKSFEVDGGYLAITGFVDEPLADQIIGTFTFTKPQ